MEDILEENEKLEQTNETENTETQTAEQNVEGVEITDTTEAKAEETKEEVRKSLRELLKENEDYQTEFNAMVQGRLNRKEREYERELSKYKDTDNVLRSTLNIQEGEDTNKKLREFYEADGVKLPEPIKPGLSSHEIEVLAKDDAYQIMQEGYDSMRDEANRLADIGYDNLNQKDKIIFTTLAEKLTEENNRKDILSVGASESILSDSNFINFKNQFNRNTPIKDIYSLYLKTKPKEEIENPGSMKNVPDEPAKKTYYSPEEARKLTAEELNDPEVMKAVEDSMTRWYKEHIQ